MSCWFMSSLMRLFLRQASQTDTLMATQVTAALHRAETARGKQPAHRGSLVEAMFQQQPATRLEMGRRLFDDQANIVQPIDPGNQRTARFEAQIALAQMMIIGGDIRRGAEIGRAHV